jgi:D-alanine-D-alanine ligase
MAKKVLVLFGGVSTEHLISCRSACNIISGLRKAGYTVIRVGITKDGRWGRFDGADEDIRNMVWADRLTFSSIDRGLPASVRDFVIGAACGEIPDVIFPSVHGINCEDGSLQGLLELSGFPYVGSGVLSSAVLMDKLYAKRLFATREQIQRSPNTAAEKVAKDIGFPCFLKPSNGGSSVGTMRADDIVSLEKALQEVARYDQTVLVEEYIHAREIEVAVLGNERPLASIAGEIATDDSVPFYDYQTKYFSSTGANLYLPAQIDPELMLRVRKLAVKAYKMAGARGLSRVDFFLDKETGRLYLNEINTIPGFTEISLYPKAWEASGVPLDKLMKKLVTFALAEAENKKRVVSIE